MASKKTTCHVDTKAIAREVAGLLKRKAPKRKAAKRKAPKRKAKRNPKPREHSFTMRTTKTNGRVSTQTFKSTRDKAVRKARNASTQRGVARVSLEDGKR